MKRHTILIKSRQQGASATVAALRSAVAASSTTPASALRSQRSPLLAYDSRFDAPLYSGATEDERHDS